MSRILMVLLVFVLLTGISLADSDEYFNVVDVKLSSTDWGIHQATIKIACLAEYYRFLVATAEVNFPGNIVDSKRLTKRSYILLPPDEVELELPYIIPGNVGDGSVLITLYDVVDTLDPLLESQKFYARQFKFNIKLSESAQILADSGIQVPSLLGRAEMFDNVFNRLLILLLHRGKSAEEIARMTGVTVGYITKTSIALAKKGLLVSDGTIFRPTFTFIENEKVEALIPVIEETTDKIYNTMIINIPAYDSTIEVMASRGEITNDKQNVLQGGSVLYHKFPTYLGLYFWELLGSRFINEGHSIMLFNGSDPCRGKLGEYMFMVSGPEENVGTTFYNKFMDPNSNGFYCGATEPKLICDGRSWAFEKENSPIYYTYNPEKVKKPMTVLARGVYQHLTDLEKTLVENFPDVNEKSHFKGIRYWCWGLIVEKLMKRLLDTGYLEQEGNGTFLMQVTEF